MIENEKVLRFLESFSIITVGENKVPNFPWKTYQVEKHTQQSLLKDLNYKGGIIKKDGTEIQPTTNIGIVTGFEDLEVIDVDTKVFSTQQEKDDFFNEYIETLKENIIDFDDKIVIYKTKSGGYHLLYKSKRVVGNSKLAVLKGHKEAVVETRGNGGYVFVYPENKISKNSYFGVDYITDSDREIIWNVSKSYNHEKEAVIIPRTEQKNYTESTLTPWDDFNNQNQIFDVVSDEFVIPPRGIKNKHILVRRHGTTAPHSGYIFKDSNCLYLFSTGTIYPDEKLISPFVAYTYKYHNGDFKEATKDLYNQGFGERLKSKIEELKPDLPEKIEFKNVSFPIEVFPDGIQFYLKECADKLDSNIDFMGVSMLWLASVCIGNSYEIEVKRGWKENGVVWIAVVGKAGIGKTPSINNVIFPLQKSNSKEIKKYITEKEKYDYYHSLSKKDKDQFPEPILPKKTQFIANDITLEALVELHQESDNAVGVFKDELAGWLKDMNKYRAGSDLEFWLSCWSGKSVSMNRKTAKSSFVEKPFIPVLGGIQPSIFNSFSTEENKENGFMDRMLLSFPDATVDEYNDNELDYDTIKWYSESMVSFYETFKKYTVRNETTGDVEPQTCRFTPDAKKEWKRIFNTITGHQNNEDENEYLKSMYPKQKSYIPRFALLIHCFDAFFDNTKTVNEISKESILKAEKVSEYFISVAKKVKYESTEMNEIKNVSKKVESKVEKIQAIYNDNNDFNRTKVAELLGVSRQYVVKVVKKIEEQKQ